MKNNRNLEREGERMKYVCSICGYIYDEAENDLPFDELPEDWKCPLCGAPKSLFNPKEEIKKETKDKYVCSVCGYIYDEAENDLPFDELPEDWKCPLCGAPKELFNKMEKKKEVQNSKERDVKREVVESHDRDDLVQLSPGELSALFSNLARGCEKQYQEEAMKCFNEIASYFEEAVPDETDIDIKHLADLIKEDLDSDYESLISAADEVGDRGTLRITTWGEKVTRMASGLIERYITEGESFLEDTNVYVCTVCGFIYVGDNPPELCPVCKVPSWKFEKIDGREI